MTEAEHIIRVKSRARPATYNVPMKFNSWAFSINDRGVWVEMERRVNLDELNAMEFIGWSGVRDVGTRGLTPEELEQYRVMRGERG